MSESLKWFFTFFKLQVCSCIFPFLVFGCLAVSHLFAGVIPRYDFMLIACLLIQSILFYTGVETKDEVLVICVFHLLGLCMELFKVRIGSWSYPEFAYTKIGGVPLYSGFMYASVASYLCQAWRNFNLQMVEWPPHWPVGIVGAMIYINFFTNHYIIDLRYYIGVLILLLFFRAKVIFHINKKPYRMPVIVSFLLIGFFIWLAENVATRFGAWKYAYQHKTWAMVDYHKISSWAFLVIVSYIIVAELKMLKKDISYQQ
ncbi:DUF817 domain-containing protein [Mucilaginibacter ginkgonis]|uniref:DUF817 domain-containing protein n=1 Tax=Mucilaginibacter ginkgonis TaxID=2682091 RepID=A0A6I4INL5_9SPHI|nr:DUF817 domain-containing protein [Mucilaginibacter ginkgonis]QQL49738.1 DUF817 domain-containing protein [Mucilaginibacter ginkgonis]